MDFLHKNIEHKNLIEVHKDNINSKYDDFMFDDDLIIGLVIFNNKKLNKLILESLSCTDSDISKCAFYLLKKNYYCVDDGIWYEFLNNKWKITKNINEFMSDKLTKYYKKVYHFLKDKNGFSENLSKNFK